MSPPPPHADTPPMKTARRTTIPSVVRQPRLPAGMPNNSRQARTAEPPVYQGIPRGTRLSAVHDWVWPSVVTMVRVAVPAVMPVILTGVVEPKLNVGFATAPDGLDVMAAVSAMFPVNPLAGVNVIRAVFPVVAPAATLTVVPATVKLGVGRLMV